MFVGFIKAFVGARLLEAADLPRPFVGAWLQVDRPGVTSRFESDAVYEGYAWAWTAQGLDEQAEVEGGCEDYEEEANDGEGTSSRGSRRQQRYW